MKLKHIAYILALSTVLAGPAFAYQEIINPDGETQELDKWTFECIPDIAKQKETDPIIRVNIWATFEKPNWALRDLSVKFISFSGREYDRGEQYNANSRFFGRADSKLFLWTWGGNKKDNPEHQILGGLLIDRNKVWHYNERHSISGKRKYVDFTSTCREVK